MGLPEIGGELVIAGFLILGYAFYPSNRFYKRAQRKKRLVISIVSALSCIVIGLLIVLLSKSENL